MLEAAWLLNFTAKVVSDALSLWQLLKAIAPETWEMHSLSFML